MTTENEETDTTVAAQAVREELYEIVRGESPFEQKAREALELGRQCLDVDNGHLTRIDQEFDHWEVIASTDPPDGQFSPGLELDLGTTYCRRTIETDSQIALHDAPDQGWADDPAFETHGLHCYLATPIVLNGKPYGTVCFASADPREQFSDDETMLAELIAQLLERDLEREQYKRQLTKQTNLAIVLNRVLRHNLRNDMSVIRGLTQMMADELDNPQYGETALDTIDELIELAEKARQLDHVVAADFEREPVEITGLVEGIVQTVSGEYPNASLSVEYDERVTAVVLPNFERALTELIDNAAKHSGEAPTVSISVDPVPNAVEIRIADDGPGLADHEADVLQTGSETPLTHGTGLGLWLSHWIVTSHDGSIDATVTDGGTTMTVSVPRNPTSDVQEQVVELRRARDQYQAAFEEANDAMILIDDEARIIDANPEASSIYGLGQQALLGQPFERFLPDDFDVERGWREFKNGEHEHDTVTIVGADGVERRVSYSAATDVIPGQHLVVSRDVTEQVERKQALEETTRRLRALIEASPDAILAVDTDGAIQLWNEAAEDVFGYDADAVIGEPIQSLGIHSGEQRAEFERKFERALAGDTLHNHEIRRQTRGGDRIRLRLSTAPIRDESGAITGVIGVAKELTETVGSPPTE